MKEVIASGKVAAILNEHRVAINVGEADRVRVDDAVTVAREVEVVDPDSGEPLGTVVVPKLRMRVLSVDERLSVAVAAESVEDDDGARGLFFTALATSRRKTIVTSAGDESAARVHIKVGDLATVTRTSQDSTS